jgi:hypothetical protein
MPVNASETGEGLGAEGQPIPPSMAGATSQPQINTSETGADHFAVQNAQYGALTEAAAVGSQVVQDTRRWFEKALGLNERQQAAQNRALAQGKSAAKYRAGDQEAGTTASRVFTEVDEEMRAIEEIRNVIDDVAVEVGLRAATLTLKGK